MYKRYPKLTLILYCFLTFIIIVLSLPHIPGNSLKKTISSSQAVYDCSAQLLRLTLSADEKYRLWIPYSRIPTELIKVTLLKEDKYFWIHPGVNFWALIRAFWVTYITKEKKIGGSTITMQLARLKYRIKTRTIPGKIFQILRSLQLELLYSKRDILEAYFNLVPYGRNIEGIGAASLIYFSKEVNELVFSEMLMLTVIPQNPSSIDSEAMNSARLILLAKWIEVYPKEYKNKNRYAQKPCMKKISDLPFLAPHFVNKNLYEQPQKVCIKTTLNKKLQSLVEEHIKNYIERKRELGIKNASAMLINYQTMNVLASVGSADFFNETIQGQVDGTRARRSPGSSIKPFLYALAIEQGLVHPLTMLKDSPFGIGGFTPENSDGEFRGPLSVHDALIQSRNVPAVQLATQLKEPDLYGFLKNADVNIPKKRDYYGMALVLGGIEITMEDLIRLYAMLANEGIIRSLKYELTQEDDEGKRMLSREACFITLDILKDNPRPNQFFHNTWTKGSLSVYWKTGTSYAYKDAWSIGIFGPYVLAVWVGNFNGLGNPAFTGAKAAAPLFFQIVDAIKSTQANLDTYSWISSLNIEKVKVCSISGKIPNDSCPHVVSTIFIPGVSPITKCDIHRTILVDVKTGKRVTNEEWPGVKKEVYEFWSSDLLKIFRLAGIPRRIPPPFHPSCFSGNSGQYGFSPQITSPKKGLVYHCRFTRKRDDGVFLTANTDADVRSICWFANKEYLGKVDRDSELLWKAKPGYYVVRVVDDQGRSDATDVTVYAAN